MKFVTVTILITWAMPVFSQDMMALKVPVHRDADALVKTALSKNSTIDACFVLLDNLAEFYMRGTDILDSGMDCGSILHAMALHYENTASDILDGYDYLVSAVETAAPEYTGMLYEEYTNKQIGSLSKRYQESLSGYENRCDYSIRKQLSHEYAGGIVFTPHIASASKTEENSKSAGDCVSSSGYYHVNNAPTKYKINLNSFSRVFGMSNLHTIHLWGSAAEAWNNNTDVGSFQYDGNFVYSESTPYPPFPIDWVGCILLGWTNNTITARYGSKPVGESVCTTLANCFDPMPPYYWGGRRFFIECYEEPGGIDSLYYGPYYATHEFGHVFGVGHPNNGERAVMCSDSNCDPSRSLDLRYWDIKCAETSGYRPQMDSFYFEIYDDGTHSSEGRWDIGPDTSKVALDFGNSMVTAHIAAYGVNMFWWAPPASPLSVPFSVNYHTTILSSLTYDEYPGRYYLAFTEPADWYGYSHISDKKYLNTRYSNDNFQTSISAPLWYCLSDNCASQDKVFTAERITQAHYLEAGFGTPRTITVWIQSTDTPENPDSKRVMFSKGIYNHSTLRPSSILSNNGSNLKSAVAPGVYCDSQFFGQYDCVIAYVPHQSVTAPSGYIELYFLKMVGSSGYREITQQIIVPYTSPGNTVSDIALWRQQSKWWIAYRDMNNKNCLRIKTTTDFQTWQEYDYDGDPSGCTSIRNGPMVHWMNSGGIYYVLVMYSRYY
jgi:hypothetical protein